MSRVDHNHPRRIGDRLRRVRGQFFRTPRSTDWGAAGRQTVIVQILFRRLRIYDKD